MDMGNRENSNTPWDIFQQREDRKGVLGRRTSAGLCMYVCVGECQLTCNSQKERLQQAIGLELFPLEESPTFPLLSQTGLLELALPSPDLSVQVRYVGS